MKKIISLILILIGIYYLFNYVAYSFVWSNSNAPWEKVNAFYYPDKYNLLTDKRVLNIGGLKECRNWVKDIAADYYDKNFEKGDYECGIGCESFGDGMYICRLTIK